MGAGDREPARPLVPNRVRAGESAVEEHTQPTARLIALVNQKGGCGKTTTAVNLGACLAVSQRPVLLIDLDPPANATVSLRHHSWQVPKTIYPVLVDENIECCTAG